MRWCEATEGPVPRDSDDSMRNASLSYIVLSCLIRIYESEPARLARIDALRPL